ncbi:endonuclease 8-like 2 [Puma concolor]|uniref:Endonuclease 8-like 2 n=1 Tax=Puma concolor TaxID=9696 RepID=A0A6P6HQD9_PUMCO|nr:endonuclease 8-like 2 [Puma concolor]
MPEGPSVRKFHHLVSPFVGQQVVKTGGSSKKLNPASFQSLWLLDNQVHGKKLFLRFDPDEELGSLGNNSLPEPLQEGEKREEAEDQKQALGPSSREISSRSSQSLERVVPSGGNGLECLRGDTPAEGAERWLQVSFGLFGSIWMNEFSRAKKANKRGDWRDPIPSNLKGNIIKNEALYRAGIHPLSLGSLLSPPHLEALVDHVVEFSADWLQGKFQGKQQHTQVYQKEQCPVGHQVMKEAFGPPGGFQRLTWWCPQCQPRLPPDEQEQGRLS